MGSKLTKITPYGGTEANSFFKMDQDSPDLSIKIKRLDPNIKSDVEEYGDIQLGRWREKDVWQQWQEITHKPDGNIFIWVSFWVKNEEGPDD